MTLGFLRFSIFYTGGFIVRNFSLCRIIELEWGWKTDIQSGTTDNAANMMLGVSMLWSRLKNSNSCHYDNEKGLDVRCLSRITNLALKYCGAMHTTK